MPEQSRALWLLYVVTMCDQADHPTITQRAATTCIGVCCATVKACIAYDTSAYIEHTKICLLCCHVAVLTCI